MICPYPATEAYDVSIISSVLQSDSGGQPRAIAIDQIDKVLQGQVSKSVVLYLPNAVAL